MRIIIVSLLTCFISGTVVLHKDRHTAEAHETLSDGTKLDETVHVDPHHISHVVQESQDSPGFHRKVVVNTSSHYYGKDSAAAVKNELKHLHPRVKALRDEFNTYKDKYLHD